MLGYKRNSLSMRKTKYVHVIHGNNTTTKVSSKGKASISDERTNVDDVFLVEKMKHNILSLIHMVDGCKEVIFNSKGCFIRKYKSKRVISKRIRTPKKSLSVEGESENK